MNLGKTTPQAKSGKKEAVKIIEMVKTGMGNWFVGIEKGLTVNNF